MQGLELGADDYITKPFDVQELRLRVRNALRRSAQGTLTNPVTNLPEGAIVDEKLQECLHRDGWVMLMVSLKNIDSFRESYGFVASDDVLRAISLMIHNSMRDLGSASDFLGQISSTDFILVTIPSALFDLRERIRARLEQSLDYFYPLKDRGHNQANQLAIRICELSANDGPFKNVKQLKNMLYQQAVNPKE